MRRKALRLPTLKDFQSDREVAYNDQESWALVAKWQREGLISMRPTAAGMAVVSLTEAGKAAMIASVPQQGLSNR